MKDSTGQKLEEFEPRELIASGSFSWIYRFVNRKDGSVCAIKIAKSRELCRLDFEQEVGRRNAPLYRTELFRWGSEWLTEGRFSETLTPSELLRRQAAKLSACSDASLVKFMQAGMAEDQGYLCMEYLPGPTLRELLRRDKARVQTLIEVLEGLRRLHCNAHFDHHGDLKPENIIVTATGAKMIDPGDFLGNGQAPSVSRTDCVCVTTSAYYPLLQPNDSVACGAMLWEIVLGRQPFTSWEDSNPEIGSRLAGFEGFSLHPVYHSPYFSGAWSLHSVRRPASIIPGISEELESFLLRAIGMELNADGKIEMLRGTVKGSREEMDRCGTLLEDLSRYHHELEDLRSAARITLQPARTQIGRSSG